LAPRTDANGEILWPAQLVALGGWEAEIIRVAVPGDPNVSQGEIVRMEGAHGPGHGDRGPVGIAFPRRHDPLVVGSVDDREKATA